MQNSTSTLCRRIKVIPGYENLIAASCIDTFDNNYSYYYLVLLISFSPYNYADIERNKDRVWLNENTTISFTHWQIA